MRQTDDMKEFDGSARQATLEDLDAVLELDRATPVGRVRSDYITSRVHAGEVAILERGGRLVGYVVHRAKSFFGRDFVDLLAVAVDSRRQGVASSLLESSVHSSSTNRIFTSTNRSNTAMSELLQKAGWTFSGELDGIDEGDPELVFYRDAHGSCEPAFTQRVTSAPTMTSGTDTTGTVGLGTA
jgi:ribosomal protein S18 acetylase RimI-like enzyme